MAEFQIIEAKNRHVGQISRALRHDHMREFLLLNVDVHRQLNIIYNNSYYRRAWTIDGKLAGLGGVEGSTMSPTGLIWLALSQRAMRYPVAVVKEARRQLAEISATKKVLETTVIAGDETAQRFALYLGFSARGEGPNGRACSRDGRRDV